MDVHNVGFVAHVTETAEKLRACADSLKLATSRREGVIIFADRLTQHLKCLQRGAYSFMWHTAAFFETQQFGIIFGVFFFFSSKI